VKYTSLHGDIIRELYGPVEESLYADLVAALEIARAYQTRCQRLENELDELEGRNGRQAQWLHGAVVACKSAGAVCPGPHDLADAIERLGSVARR